MNIDIGGMIFVLFLLILLIIMNRLIVHNSKMFEKIGENYSKVDRKVRISDYKDKIKTPPSDRQKIIFMDLMILLVAVALIVMIASKSLFFAAVISSSMYPTFDKNDLILIQNIDRSFHVGDIVLFNTPDRNFPISHRIVAIDGDGTIHTEGDATGVVDWWRLNKTDIGGKVVLIMGKPVVIKGLGQNFIVQDRNQKFGPFDYPRYLLFINIIKTYGYAIIVIVIMAYIYLTLRSYKPKNSYIKK
jgi:signal peptidase